MTPSSPSPDEPPAWQVFNRQLVRRHRDRAEASFADASFLKLAASRDIAERLSSINRHFAIGLDLGAHDGTLKRTLSTDPLSHDRVGWMLSSDMSPKFAAGLDLSCSEEALPFASGSLDLVVSALSLHWVNDLPGTLVQIRQALKPDGLFVGALLGGRTLTELRACLLEAESELTGGAAMRVSPMLDVLDGARLLQRTGFALPVADADLLTVRYAHPLKLLADLRTMGETSALVLRGPGLRRDVLARAMQLYVERYSDPDGKVRASFEIITLSGWAPSPTQQKPLKPGSAQARLADVLGVKEQSAGESVIPTRKPD